MILDFRPGGILTPLRSNRVKRLLDHNPDSLITKHKIGKRFAGAALGWVITAILGLFMESQIQSLSSSYDQLAANQKHIIESISELQKATQILKKPPTSNL